MQLSKYMAISPSDVYTDETGNFLPNIFSFPIEFFRYSSIPQKYMLGKPDILRFDLLMNYQYGNANYDDIVLWLNKIEHISDILPGTFIFLPAKDDLDTFYREHYR